MRNRYYDASFRDEGLHSQDINANQQDTAEQVLPTGTIAYAPCGMIESLG